MAETIKENRMMYSNGYQSEWRSKSNKQTTAQENRSDNRRFWRAAVFSIQKRKLVNQNQCIIEDGRFRELDTTRKLGTTKIGASEKSTTKWCRERQTNEYSTRFSETDLECRRQ
jgi:hypothetical protein